MQIDNLEFLGEVLNTAIRNAHNQFSAVMPIIQSLKADTLNCLLFSLLETLHERGDLPTGEIDHFYIFRKNGVNIRIQFTNIKSSIDYFTLIDSDYIIVNPSNELVAVPRYSCKINTQDLALPPTPLQEIDPIKIEPYSYYQDVAFKSVLDYSKSESRTILFIIHTDPKQASTWLFSRSNLDKVGRVCTNIAASRCHIALKVLSAMKTPDTSALYADIATSDYVDFIRWDTVKYLYEIDQEKGIQVLKTLSTDPVPCIRRAAVRTLNSINNKV